MSFKSIFSIIVTMFSDNIVAEICNSLQKSRPTDSSLFYDSWMVCVCGKMGGGGVLLIGTGVADQIGDKFCRQCL